GGTLKSSPGADGVIGTADDLLPFNNADYFSGDAGALGGSLPANYHMANDPHIVQDSQLFLARDVRATETTELTALRTLFMRDHTRTAGLLAKSHPDGNDEQIFQEARKLNIAQYQTITYEGWLPAVLGPTTISAYSGYNSGIDPSIATEFSTVG